MTARNEVKAFRAWTKFPGSDKLRKGASAELRQILAAGWHETGRTPGADHIMIRLERPPTAQPQVQTRRRDESGGDGEATGGGGSRGGGGRGGPRGGGGGGGGRR